MDDATLRTEARRNVLLAALPEEEQDLLNHRLEPVQLPLRLIIEEPDRPIEYAWFPHSGVVSIVSEMEDGGSVEVATVGREGFVGLPLVLDADAMPYRTLVQVPGKGERIPAAAFTALLPRLPTLHRLVLRYAMTLVTQIAQGSACNRMHPVEARCARWLLMTHDRVDSDTFPLTQEFLSQMLGVTRPSVSIAAGMLQRAGLIQYARGTVRILDRRGLEAASCECYRIITDEFRRLVGTAV